MSNRKYSSIWEELKACNRVQVTITNSHLYTPEQLARNLKTLRKAIVKEKYMDFKYKAQHPNALIESTLIEESGVVVFTLDPDTRDIAKLFS